MLSQENLSNDKVFEFSKEVLLNRFLIDRGAYSFLLHIQPSAEISEGPSSMIVYLTKTNH